MEGYRKGLEGVVAVQTEISLVDGSVGRLLYRGYDIADIAQTWPFERAAYLLLFGSDPAGSALDAFRERLIANRHLDENTIAVLEDLSTDIHPIDVLRTVLSASGAATSIDPPDADQAVSVIARVPTILAHFYRRRQGLPPMPPDSSLDHAVNYLWMLKGERPTDAQVGALNAYMVMLADHGMNSSTFTARVIASTGSDLASSVVGATGALKGPAHGGAPSFVMEQMDELSSFSGSIDEWANSILERRQRFMGFGHRVYRTYDPRARILRQMCADLNPAYYNRASAVEEVVMRVLADRYPNRPMATNVEFYSAGVLEFIGLPTFLFTPTFAAARSVGWCAHVLEQNAQQKSGIANIIRPESEYVGPDQVAIS